MTHGLFCIFQSAWMQHFPPSERAGCAFSTGRLADFRSVPGQSTQPYRYAASSLGVPRAMCRHAEEHSHPESVYITYLGVCFDSVKMRARLSQERSATILSSLCHFRIGSSVHLKKFQRLLGLMASASAECHLGLLHMHPLHWAYGFRKHPKPIATPQIDRYVKINRNFPAFERVVTVLYKLSC